MDLKQLSCFLEVAEQKNFTLAAKKLHYAVSTTTQYVHALEEELGIELFVPSSRPLTLTEAGRYFYERTSDLLFQMDQVVRESRNIAQYASERLVVGFFPEDVNLLDLLKQHFRALYPNRLLSMRQFSSYHKLDALLKGQCDVLVCRTDPGFRNALLEQRPFFTTRLCCRVPAAHPLANQSLIRFEDLKNETLAIVTTGTYAEQRRFEQKFHELCPGLTLYVFDHYDKADAVSRAYHCMLLCFEHTIRQNLSPKDRMIEFEEPNECSYSLITKISKKR